MTATRKITAARALVRAVEWVLTKERKHTMK